ncbi:hypothetical protein [Nodosilinea sp. P-1105]|uniref:hypothetical protein n=1 Tax=Nodosilinea sp. P-1105 TaxID=2546229 RepID=UPI00146A746E|nr:hypothetical protein [Nodosilinea sp. P-1105]NMF86695.1 hypothetical protein [Nodosilinea sp. P-1105]
MKSLDAEEAAILASVELGEWQSVPNLSEEVKRYQRYAPHNSMPRSQGSWAGWPLIVDIPG